ncbi:chain-length determining protein [Prevotella conceptionensis]|jgi:chain length determinant protein|uniref:chain-length determining protein n=1 Tax=Prevotella conceptionensis TaxID=340486 RepID=UPI000303DA5D|nr:chain-length determining protein [Prevotella conceptionensis]
MENVENDKNVVDLRSLLRKIWIKRISYTKVLSITFILSCLYIIGYPRYYETDTKLAPEIETPGKGGALGSIASSLGIDLSDIQSKDAITPLLYPSLLEDNKFVSNLFTIPVQTSDKSIYTSYYDYLANRQKQTWWEDALFFLKKKEEVLPKTAVNPYNLTKEQSVVMEQIRHAVKLSVDSKNGVITITTQAQDPLICKTLADSVRNKLQAFITEYRTTKARNDMEYYKKLVQEAKQAYEKSRKLYTSYSDANTDLILESFRAKREDLENDMQLKFNTYTTLATQLQSAKAKVQEKTPAFTILKGATVPLKPAGPKRMFFVLTIMLLVFVVQSLWLLRKELGKLFN